MADVTALLNAIEEPAFLVSGHRLVAANNAARDVFARRLLHEDIRLVIRHPAVLAAVEARREATLEVEGIGGVDRPWRVKVTPLEDGSLLLRMIDRAAARAAERMRTDFVANASHELRTPLTTIRGYAETLAEDGDLDPELRGKFAATIESESIRMLRIVGDLLDLSRIEADRFVRPTEKVAIEEIVAEAVEANGELASRRGCHLVVDIEGGLPPLFADPAQVRQLIDNLLANAIRYGCTPDNPEVTVSLARAGRFVRLSVADKGEGIAPEHLPRLTERFYRADAARSRTSGGTGLGLAIVKHIVERHRGALDIASTLGRGTVVSVDLPVE